ncbi:hypothetical protein K435DRAFT_805395 [Dendrothele bispora CBS 962.96]|uniref:Uncharacterized protein n=1 Tax=Dendrothele bispora (strain CBS 962.96) TaxID=1314807 RepID=A0A4S8LBM1_DENBC|nr:hypothetical protein K435DRAFT_805395 [Dendrothele bispora CBS 962.96]
MVSMNETPSDGHDERNQREKKKTRKAGNKSGINLTEFPTPAGVKYSLLSIGDASVASRHTQKNLQKKCKLAVLGETLNTRREGGSRPIRGDKENESEIHGKAYAKTKREKGEEKMNRKRSTFTEMGPLLKKRYLDLTNTLGRLDCSATCGELKGSVGNTCREEVNIR